MNGREVVKIALSSTQNMLGMYLSDLSDADLLVRPVPGANHLAWQLGHLVSAEAFLLGKDLPEATYPELPADFAQRYGREGAGVESSDGFLSRQEYLDLF